MKNKDELRLRQEVFEALDQTLGGGRVNPHDRFIACLRRISPRPKRRRAIRASGAMGLGASFLAATIAVVPAGFETAWAIGIALYSAGATLTALRPLHCEGA